MTTLRSYIDPNQQSSTIVSPFPTDTHLHEVRCGMCAKELYVDDASYRLYIDTTNAGLDNPFRCETCNEEYDDLAFEG